MMKSERLNWKETGIFGFLALFISFQSPLHPFAQALPATDSSVYLYAAERMNAGGRLYFDFFDHKGPFLYFLNAFPLKIFGGQLWSVWLLETAFLFLDCILIYKIAALFLDKRTLRVLTAAAVLYPLGFYFEGGNFTEEYALPFLLGGMYYYLKYMIEPKRELPLFSIGVIGFFCGLVVLLRVNMIVLFGIYALVLVCFFVRKGWWECIWKSILAFLTGFLASMLPAVLGLALKGLLHAFCEAYFVFNMQYSVGSNSFFDILRAMYVFWAREPFLPLSLVVCVGGLILAVWERKEEMGWIHGAGLVTMLVSLYSVAMSGRTYGHYAMSLIPCFVVPTVLLIDAVGKRFRKDFAVVFLTGLALAAGAPKYAAGFLVNIADTLYMDQADKEIISYIEDHSKEDEDVLVLGNYCMYYLGADRNTDNRYFYQTPILDINEAYRKDFFSGLENSLPVLLVAPHGELDFSDEKLEEYVESEIYVKEIYDTFTAYVRE